MFLFLLFYYFIIFVGQVAEPPIVMGNKTEGALLTLIRIWGFNHDTVKTEFFHSECDTLFPFDSTKKRSTALLHQPNGTIRLYTKGATEVLLLNCTMYTDSNGETRRLTTEMTHLLEKKIEILANQALRTLMLCHIDYQSINDLPENWKESPPDDKDLICDSIIGIIGETVLTLLRLFILIFTVFFVFFIPFVILYLYFKSFLLLLF